MTASVRALLIGINDYAPPVRPLGGCVNDIERMHGWLKESVGSRLAAEVLTNRDATRANVLKMFREHLGRAEAGDVVLVQYCGHGSQSGSATEFHEFYPDGLDEGLVLADSRLPGGFDLADKELALLIGELARKDVHLTFILDSCHSGSGTRSADAFAGLQSRLTLGDTRSARPLETYLDGAYRLRRAKGQPLRASPGRHMLLAACERTQEAKESIARRTGVFSMALVDVLEASGGKLSYADLFVRCRAAVRQLARDQDPQFEPVAGFDAWSGFLGGAAGSRSLRHSVFFDAAAGAWKVDAGAIHGLGDAPDRAIGLALYDEADQTRAAGTAHTIEIGAQSSIVMFDGAPTPPADARFRAALTSLPAAPLLVFCDADEASRRALQQALDDAAAAGPGAPLGASGVLLGGDRDGLRYGLLGRDGAIALVQIESDTEWDRAPVGPGGFGPAAATLLRPLKTIAQWERLLGLHNRASAIGTDAIDFVLEEAANDSAGGEPLRSTGSVTLESTLQGGEWSAIRALVRMRNRSGRTLHVVLVHFSADYGIQVLSNDPVPAGDRWVTLYGDAADQSFFLDEAPDGQGMVEALERFKLLVSTEPVDSFHFEQAGLGPRTRGIGARKSSPPRQQDWLTKDLRVRIVPRIDAIGAKAWQSGDGAIVIKPHRRLRAQLNLASARPATRGPGEELPFVAAFERAGVSVAGLGSSRAAAGAPSVIELTGIEGAESLAAEPLEIEIHQPLAADETLLSFAWDGRHVLPCGEVTRDGDTTRIVIDAIPETPSDRRSLGGSLKLYFFKTYLKRTELNRLRWIDFAADGGWAYRDDDLPAQVARAKRVLLMVHGIIGDTEGMAAGARDIGLNRKFDLVLTYDYENLSTPIADTARTLKRQLAEAGLRSGDGKHLTLLVHSMGGLVSRWFIEREGGNEVVDHLVMCGTPNNGSPFGKIDGARKIIGMLLGLAANYVPTLIPFTAPVMLLLNRSQKVTPTLQQMDPDSLFIRDLNGSADPGIPYTILAGNVDEYREPTDDVFARLLAKTGQSAVFDALFSNKANDIAVSIESITGIGAGRARLPKAQRVACHHLNYFVSAAGQQALKTIDW